MHDKIENSGKIMKKNSNNFLIFKFYGYKLKITKTVLKKII